jgi:hypothetical protein
LLTAPHAMASAPPRALAPLTYTTPGPALLSDRLHGNSSTDSRLAHDGTGRGHGASGSAVSHLGVGGVCVGLSVGLSTWGVGSRRRGRAEASERK